MILSTIQPSFLPWLGYFEQAARADLFVYLDDVQYTKQDWRNRNRFKAANGKIEYLTVPIRAEDAAGPINKVRVAEGLWAQKLLNRLEEWYRKAPAFSDYFPAVREELLKGHGRLSDLNVALTGLLSEFMRIETPIAFSSAIGGKSPDKNQKLIDICRHFGADMLYDGAAAASFIDLDLFRANGIEVVFQDYQPVPYHQLGGGEFLSHLSALDALFNCGDGTRQVMHDGGAAPKKPLGRSMQHPICPVCGSAQWETFLAIPSGRSLLTDQTIAQRDLAKVICACCGLVSNADFAGDRTLRSYENDYQLNSQQGEEHIYFTGDGPVPRSQAYLSWINRHLDIDPGSILEIGCGKGSLLARFGMQYPAIPVRGIEGSRKAAEIARRRGLDVEQGFVGEEEFAPADLLIAVGVLEHVEDPVAFLEALQAACSPSGRAVFVVPLQDSGGYDLFFADHVWHFFRDQFLRLLTRTGWQVLTFNLADPVVHGMGLAYCKPLKDRALNPDLPGQHSSAPQQLRNRDAWLHRFGEANRRLEALQQGPIIVFGSGEVLSLLLAYTGLCRIEILACLDEDAGKIASKVHGIAVHGLDWLKDAPAAPIFVTVNPRYNDAVGRKLAEYGRPLVFWGDSW